MSETVLEPPPSLALLGELEVEDARLYARKAQALVDYRTECEAAGSPRSRFVELELAVVCGIGQRTAAGRLAEAERLVWELPGTHALLLAGRLRVGHGKVLLAETAGLSTELCARLEAVVLPQLPDLTPGEAGRLVKRTLLALDGSASEQRREQQHRERRAFLSPQPDGRAFVGVHGSAEAATGFWDQLTLLSKLTFGADDPRTLDQQRADLALALSGFALAGRHGHGPSLRAFLGLPEETDVAAQPCSLSRRNELSAAQQRRVQAVVLVPVQTGLGLADDPAELVGYGPVSAGHARDLLAAAELRKACVDLDSGRLIALSDARVAPLVGRWWAQAYPWREPVEVASGHGRAPAGPFAGPSAGPPGGPPGEPTAGPPDGSSAGTSATWSQGASAGPPAESSAGPPFRPPESPRLRRPQGLPMFGFAVPGEPLTLHDALMQMVDQPLPAESRVEDQHDPSPDLADLIRFRDPRCIGPGCCQPSRLCDLEHWYSWPHGKTTADNVGPASRRCHNAKTYGGWGYTPHPDGSITWTTPWGQTYRKASRTRPVDLTDLRRRQVAPPPHQRPQE